jgi:integrase/recombinase XerD
MDEWAWEQLEPWSNIRPELPVGPLFCVINRPTSGYSGRPPPFAPSYGPPRPSQVSGVASLQPRHAPAVEMAHEGVPK